MKWSKPIPFAHPVRDVSLSAGTPKPDPAAVLRDLEERAYARGLADGERRLGEQMLQQRNELQDLQTGVLNSLQQAVSQVVRDTEDTLIEFAFELAQKVVAEDPISRELIETNIRSALAQVRETTEYFIHLHPDDLALLQRHSSELLSTSPRQETMHFLASPDTGRGGCLVRTRFGIIDARRETRLQLIRQSLGT